ncbi:hypothetical protein ABTO04_19615, partial [Acinetobacter baumannii]
LAAIAPECLVSSRIPYMNQPTNDPGTGGWRHQGRYSRCAWGLMSGAMSRLPLFRFVPDGVSQFLIASADQLAPAK